MHPSSTAVAAEIPFSRFEWQKLPNGPWGRDIDECELFYKLSSREQNACLPVTGCASFIISLPNLTAIANGEGYKRESCIEDVFRMAWMSLCYRHPTLRSRIEHDENSGRWRRVYSTLHDRNEEQKWLKSTFEVIKTDATPLQWFNNNATDFDISSLFLVRSKQQAQCQQTIFLRCPHDVTDGIGVLQLVDQLFSHAAAAYEGGSKYVLPEWGNEYARLSPSLRVAAAIPESVSTQTEHFKAIQTRNGTVYNHTSLLGLPSSSGEATLQRGKRQRCPLVIPKDTTDQILNRCKTIAPGVSVTHVFMAALAQALADLQPRKEESYPVRCVNHSMINLRPYCRAPYNSPDHAAATYHTVSAQALGIDLLVPSLSASAKSDEKMSDLRRIAIEVRDYYKSVRPLSPTDDQIHLAPLMFQSLTPPPGSNPHAVSDPPLCPVALSSIGNISSMVSSKRGPFQITEVWAASEPIGAGVVLFLGAWDGKIELSGVFDIRYHDATYIEQFLDCIVNCVYSGLGIGDHHTPN